MSCSHYYQPILGGDTAFAVEAASVVFGRGAVAELGDHACSFSARRVAVFSDRQVTRLASYERALSSLRAAGCDVVPYDEVQIEPSDQSFAHAARFAREARPDTYVSIGGGSVIDTCKAALLYATYPADFLTYVNRPVGQGLPPPGPLPPHIACPTTSGTGSECTGIAVCGLSQSHAKVGIAHRLLRPSRALIDPDFSASLPKNVVAASGFDVLCHAIESYTAKPYSHRLRPDRPTLRPMSQGSNPWSDLGSLQALRLCGRYLLRAVADPQDHEAREQMMYAATLAGIAFGNAGVHIPHGMAYAVAGGVRTFRMDGYPEGAPLVPHGVSVIVTAPAVVRFTAAASPQRHLDCAVALGADVADVAPTAAEAGARLSAHLLRLMQDCQLPNGLHALGYEATDIFALTEGSAIQRRLLDNAPCAVEREHLEALFAAAMTCW
jgi:hydroxyacid-oxoacid transhydrogenase